MSSSIWIIFILLMGAVLGYLYLKSRGRIGWTEELQSKLSNLMSQGETLEVRLGAATKKEKEKAEVLKKVLDAKRELAIARATSTKLRKEIASISEASVSVEQTKKR